MLRLMHPILTLVAECSLCGGGVGGVVGMQTRVYFLFLTCLLELLINKSTKIHKKLERN